jgi:hypothetical protein
LNGYFLNSPFGTTASPETAACWSGRTNTLASLLKLQRSWKARSDSSLDLLWASLGAGKSHALYHLADRLTRAGGFVVAFVEVPDQIRSFRDLYTRLIGTMDIGAVATIAAPHCKSDDVRRGFQAILHGNSIERGLAREWLIAGNPLLADLRRVLGITQRLESDGPCADALVSIVSALAAGGIRLVVLLDEFQRVGTASSRGKASLLTNLRSIFSRSPGHFSVVVSVASRVEATARNLLTPELQTLMGARKLISLPALDRQEALDFVEGRLACFRPDGYVGSSRAPFENTALEVAIDGIIERDADRLMPRWILQVLAAAYDEAIAENEEMVSVEHVRRVIDDFRADD